MINPKHSTTRPKLGGIARKTGSVALAAMLSLSLAPSLAFAEEVAGAEGGEPTEQTAQPTTTETSNSLATTAQNATQPETKQQAKETTGQMEQKEQSTGTGETTTSTQENTPNATPKATTSQDVTLTFSSNNPMANQMLPTAFSNTGTLVDSNGNRSLNITLTDASKAVALKGITYGGTYYAAENMVVTLPITSFADGMKIDASVSVTIPGHTESQPYPISITVKQADQTSPEQPGVDKTKLSGMIGGAQATLQRYAQKTDEAKAALKSAIEAAQKVADNSNATAEEVRNAMGQLGAALTAFTNSADKPSAPSPEKPGSTDNEKPSASQAVATPDGMSMIVDKQYADVPTTVDIQIDKAGLPPQMLEGMPDGVLAKTFANRSIVSWNGSKYVVTFSLGSERSAKIITAVLYEGKELARGADGLSYTVETSSLKSPLNLIVRTAMTGTTDVPTTLAVDTKAVGENAETPKDDKKPETGSNNQNQNQNSDNKPAAKAEKFQVGHTYRVPIAFTKEGSSETSMAAKYFGTTALVRPKADGTFDVTFAATSEGLNYITSLKYKGKALTRSGDQFTVNIPAAERDTTVPIEMDITMLKTMGINDPVTSDMHLYLSRAEDLGDNAGDAKASSNPPLAQTGDESDAAGLVTLAALAAGGMAVAARRRREELAE